MSTSPATGTNGTPRKRRAQSRAPGRQGERTRRRLLDAARESFAERGYPATRVDDITRKAGTSHGAFYLYFSNKQELLEALAGETSERMFSLAGELEGIEVGERGYERIRDWVGKFVDAYAGEASVITAWIQAGEDPRFEQLGSQVLEKFAARIAHAIQWSVDADVRHPIHAGIAAVALVAMLERLCYFWLVRGGPFPREAAIDTLAAIWYQAIFGAEHDRRLHAETVGVGTRATGG